MTFTVTPEPQHQPPRVRIEISSDDVAKPFTSLTVLRDGDPIREQPFLGGSEVTVFDYEAPFGVPVTYSADGAVGTYSPIHDEQWTSLAGWTQQNGTPSISGSHLHDGSVYRALAFPPSGRIVSQGLLFATTGENRGARLNFGWIDLFANRDNESFYAGTNKIAVSGLSSPFTVTWAEGAATLVTVAGRWVLNSNEPAGNVLSPYTDTRGGAYVDDFVVSTATEVGFAGSATDVLDVDEAWLIHPTFSALSCSIDRGQHKFRDDGINVARATKSSVARGTKATRHDPVGDQDAVFFSSGPRSKGEWTLVLRTRQLSDRDTAVAICDDHAPLLLRCPVGWVWDLPDGWYQVGETEESRPKEGLHHPDREISLPLVPTRAPALRLAAAWTFGMDLLRNPTFADSLAEFPTFLDRLVGP
jgi:hypothetical protein